MTELLNNAWGGWQDFTEAGKPAALLLISLLFLWLYYKKVSQRNFLVYTTVATVCCIFPVTAAGLMLYQTKFYDYKWIWSMVPLTAMVGYAVTVWITDLVGDIAKNDKKKGMGAVALLLGLLVLSSGLGAKPWDGSAERQEREAAETVLARVQERVPRGDICLWAPREIMEYAREFDPGIRLLYGRNMWDPQLNAYAYDTYSGELKALERWIRGYGEEEPISDRECAETVAGTEVNCILLPENSSEETIECFEEIFGAGAEALEGYYLLVR